MKNTIITTLTMLWLMSALVFADQRTDFYASAADKAGKEEIASAYRALGTGSVNAEQAAILRLEVEHFRAAGREDDAKFIEGKLGAKAPVVAEAQPEPVKIVHGSHQKGWERERGIPAHRDKLQYQITLWTGLRDKETSDLDKKDAFTSYAKAYELALKAYNGTAVSDDEKRTYGPILDHFETEARTRGFAENAKAIHIAIEKGGFLRTLDTPAYSAAPAPVVPAPVVAPAPAPATPAPVVKKIPPPPAPPAPARTAP